MNYVIESAHKRLFMTVMALLRRKVINQRSEVCQSSIAI
jgi:hypothetical protein